jgi:Xaa-Pro aminopeptidase
MTPPGSEREHRWSRVRAGMSEARIDCLIVVGNAGLNLYRLADLHYLTGMAREGVLLFPLEGEPVMLSFGGGHDPSAWVTDHRNGYPRFAEGILGIIADRGWDKATFGALLSGYEGDLNFPLRVQQAMAHAFPDAALVDAAPILASVRRIKTDFEIQCFKAGCEVGLRAIAAVAERARQGVSDLDVKTELMGTLFSNGCASHTLLLFHSGNRSVHGAMGGSLPSPTGRTLEAGDVINTEFDAMFEGYCAQFNQPFFLGEVDGTYETIAAIGAECFAVGVDALKPGLTAGELQARMRRPVEAHGYQALGPMFHGLGLSFEPPIAQTSLGTSLPEDLDIVFEPGMVVELEPHVVAPDFSRGCSIGCPVLVTESGCETLAGDWKAEPVRIAG